MIDLVLNNHCSLFNVPTSQSSAGMFWQGAIGLWAELWPYILLLLAVIVITEVLTRHKNPYNSANGFTPDFNRLVGSLSYMLLQLSVYIFIYFMFGNVAYCFPWPYAAHAVVFSLNFAILHRIGFWPERKKPHRWRRRRKR